MTLLLLTALLIPPTAHVTPPGQEAVTLSARAIRTWEIELPADPFQKISGSLPIAHDGGSGFAVSASGTGFEIDTDGDGVLDRKVDGREDPETKVRGARVTVSGLKDGEPFRYPARMELRPEGWAWASSSVLEGMIGKTPVQLIDVDGNGRYTDVGTDAIGVNGSNVAQFLGETLLVDGELRSIALSGEGATVVARTFPFEGQVGTLDLRSEFGGKGVMLGAVVQSVDRKHSFELSAMENGAKVPAGRYRLVAAKIGLGEARATVDTRMMGTIRVKKEAKTALQWGAPIKATFVFDRKGSEITLDPEKVKYTGAAGERWVGWDPVGKSPTFHIKDAETGEVLVDAVFPGSC
ncbi:hypothetical protein Poly30_15340 [Planctomycetes bacterium Poly30]|uniref:Uncharacterized protein n=1 Tax=Saltatorellus ferox TaxID=2528018 RepID=A0A518EPM8_9BACT|nr:hypothetical protein Poly30_15340 [Planctomycetes bacterium Poly30]